MSALCHKRTFCAGRSVALFDHLVCAGEQCWRHGEVKHSGTTSNGRISNSNSIRTNYSAIESSSPLPRIGKCRACYHFATQLLSTEQDRAALDNGPCSKIANLFKRVGYGIVREVIVVAGSRRRCTSERLPLFLFLPAALRERRAHVRGDWCGHANWRAIFVKRHDDLSRMQMQHWSILGPVLAGRGAVDHIAENRPAHRGAMNA